jgi:hypothetical protein
MKTKGVPKWYVEFDRDLLHYCVIKDGFRDSIFRTRYEALERIIELEEKEK